MEGKPATIGDIMMLNIHGTANDFVNLDSSLIRLMEDLLQDDNDPEGQFEVIKLYNKMHRHDPTTSIDMSALPVVMKLVTTSIALNDNLKRADPALEFIKTAIEHDITGDFGLYKDVLYLTEAVLLISCKRTIEKEASVECIFAMLQKFGPETTRFITNSPTFIKRIIAVYCSNSKTIISILLGFVENMDGSQRNRLLTKIYKAESLRFVLHQGLKSAELFTIFQSLRLIQVLIKEISFRKNWIMADRTIMRSLMDAISTPNIEISTLALDIFELIPVKPLESMKHLLDNLCFVMMCGDSGYSFELKLQAANNVLRVIKHYMEINDQYDFSPFFRRKLRVPTVVYDQEILDYSVSINALSSARARVLMSEQKRNIAQRYCRRLNDVSVTPIEMIRNAKNFNSVCPEIEDNATDILQMTAQLDASSDDSISDLDSFSDDSEQEMETIRETTGKCPVREGIIEETISSFFNFSHPRQSIPIQRSSLPSWHNSIDRFRGTMDLNNPFVDDCIFNPYMPDNLSQYYASEEESSNEAIN